MSWLGTLQAADEAVLQAARGSPAWAVPIFYVCTLIGAGWGLVVLVPFLFREPTRRATSWLLGAIVLTSGTVSLVKALVGRTRPCDVLGWCAPILVASPGGGSFPSGHAAGSFAFAAFVSTLSPRLAFFALPYAALVAWSRCVLGVHYPSDVIGGALVGSLIGYVAARLAEPRRQSTAPIPRRPRPARDANPARPSSGGSGRHDGAAA